MRDAPLRYINTKALGKVPETVRTVASLDPRRDSGTLLVLQLLTLQQTKKRSLLNVTRTRMLVALTVAAGAGLAAIALQSCSKDNATAPSNSSSGITSDAALFKLITQTEPFSGYNLFPNADAITSGTLNGSTAHQPLVRVSINAKALSSLQNGKLPSGAKFQDGSVVLKEIRNSSGVTTEMTVMYKDSGNSLAGNGWLWAAFSPSGGVGYSITGRGAECTSCHSRDRGPQNDSVRTFERQKS